MSFQRGGWGGGAVDFRNLTLEDVWGGGAVDFRNLTLEDVYHIIHAGEQTCHFQLCQHGFAPPPSFQSYVSEGCIIS